MLKEFLKNPQSTWTDGKGKYPEIVLSSRVRLARNLKQYPFPLLDNSDDLQKVLKKVAGVMNTVSYLNFYHLEDLTPLERLVLVEKHLISPGHIHSPEAKGLIINPDGSISIMVNEEDHLRIQCFASGLELEKILEDANKLDDLFEEQLDYAYSEKYGYLTCCPTNLGTGMRISVMVHLPALVLTKQAGIILNQLSQIGITVRGLYGEGTEVLGNLFQISNQITLGQSEEEILSNIDLIVRKIVDQEKKAREYLLDSNGLNIADKTYRAYGILTNAKIISSQEALNLISDLRLGKTLGMMEEIPLKLINELFLVSQPAFLQILYDKEMDAVERDIKRAEMFKKMLRKNLEV